MDALVYLSRVVITMRVRALPLPFGFESLSGLSDKDIIVRLST